MRNTKTKRKKQRLSKTSTSIAIIGTGPAALSTALSLQQAGFSCIKLYERDINFNARKDGYGLTLTYNPSSSLQSPLMKMGLLEELARRDCPSRAHYVFNAKGQILGYYGNAFSDKHSCKGLGQRGNLRVPRQVLRKVMIDTLLERDVGKNNVSIEWGRKLKSYTQTNSLLGENLMNSPDEKCDNKKPITLQFEDGTSATADLLIGADGVRSSVIQTLLSSKENRTLQPKTLEDDQNQVCDNTEATVQHPKKNPADLSYIGIMIVLGITRDFFHPLLDERGFYTLDGCHRLFTMPFEGSKIHDLEQYDIAMDDASMGPGMKRTRRYMWQLSFKLNHEDAIALSKSGSQGLLNDVLKRTENWHEPVQDMIRASELESVWGTPLMDRDPKKVLERINEIYHSNGNEDIRALVCGDAVHAMSPFKGQGCNQALMDGPLLCSWIERSNIDSSVKGFMREMVQRTNKKVMASREAAKFLHSEDVLLHEENFAGVKAESVKALLKELRERSIDAKLAGSLDREVSKVIEEMGISEQKKLSESDQEKNSKAESEALDFAAKGNTAGIRVLSMTTPESIHSATHKDTGETCIHLAAKSGCYHTVKWLISEAGVDHNVLDFKKESVLHAAAIGGNAKVLSLLAKVCKNSMICWGKNSDGKAPIDVVALNGDKNVMETLSNALNVNI